MLNAAVIESRDTSRKQPGPSIRAPLPAVEPVRIALLGVGTVGEAFLQRLEHLAGSSITRHLDLVHVANSRRAWTSLHGEGWRDGTRGLRANSCASPGGERHGRRESAAGQGPTARWISSLLPPLATIPLLAGEGLQRASAALGGHGTRILIDATASDDVAEHHAHWLSHGVHVVTACKLGQGTSLARWRAIREACAQGGSHYGDAATVGAGLPMLRSLRELQAGGDRIASIAGVLSGSLAWLFNHYDGMRPFSALVRQAREAGYTEPDPREDLSGEDVRRKLLILARAAGFELEASEVDVSSLVPDGLRCATREMVDEVLPVLDAPLRERYAQAYRRGERLRFIARLERDAEGGARARVGVEALAPDHPLAGGAGNDNRVAIGSDRYRDRPLLIQGPGAGAQVTAAALLDDVLRIARA